MIANEIGGRVLREVKGCPVPSAGARNISALEESMSSWHRYLKVENDGSQSHDFKVGVAASES